MYLTCSVLYVLILTSHNPFHALFSLDLPSHPLPFLILPLLPLSPFLLPHSSYHYFRPFLVLLLHFSSPSIFSFLRVPFPKKKKKPPDRSRNSWERPETRATALQRIWLNSQHGSSRQCRFFGAFYGVFYSYYHRRPTPPHPTCPLHSSLPSPLPLI